VFTTLGMLYTTKLIENSTDYSVMNTARQMFWLVTSREEKYKAKQAADTFVVRLGDLLSFVFCFAGTVWLGLGPRGLLLGMVAVIAVWLMLAVAVVREYRRLSDLAAATAAA